MNKNRKSYDSDLTDAQWELIGPLLDEENRDFSKGGRLSKYPLRCIFDAISYVDKTGCQWRYLPGGFPPWQTTYWWFRKWKLDGTTKCLHDSLVERVRVSEGRNKEPSAAVVDSQSVKASDTVGMDRRGYDAGKKVNGTKRHLIVDTIGMILVIAVSSASVQDRDGAKVVTRRLSERYSNVTKIWADAGYAGKFVKWAYKRLGIGVEVVKRSDDVKGFQVVRRRWVVERTFSWLMHSRRLCRDYERTDSSAVAFIHWSMIGRMSRRLTNNSESFIPT